MRTGNYVKLLMALFGAAYSVVIIPDTVHKRALRLVHYAKDGTWYQADRVCRSDGGYLVLVDGPLSVLHLNQLRRTTGSKVKDVFTRMIRHDDDKFYSYDDQCSPVDTSSWSWKNEKDEDKEDLARQCVRLDEGFLWKKKRCDYRLEFVCEFRDGGACDFRMTSVSLISLPVNDASMAVCQAACRQMIGCFATAPSGHATLPPFTHCLFVVTGDDSNPMATFDDCPNQYLRDTVTNPDRFPPPVGNDSTTDPDDCVPRSRESSDSDDDSDEGDKVLDMLQQAPKTVECTTTTIYPTKTETAYVTLTPDVVTDHITPGPDVIAINAVPIVSTHYVTLTPDVMTKYLTLTPDVIIDYVTLPPDVVTVSLQTPCPSDITTAQFSAVTTTVDRIVPTTVELQLTTTAEKIQTTTVVQPVPTTVTEERLVTMTAVLSQQPCSSAELTVSEITTTEIQFVTQTETVNAATPALMTETETRFVTHTVTPAAVMVTTTIPETLVVTAAPALVTVAIPDTGTVVEAQSQTETATPVLITTTVPQSLSSDQGLTEIQPETETTTVCAPPSSVPECPNTTYPFANKYENKTEEEFEEELHKIVKELKVNPVNVSRSRRKKESAPDERKSAQSLGAMAVGVMVVGVVLLVLVDGSTLFCYIHRLVKVRHDGGF